MSIMLGYPVCTIILWLSNVTGRIGPAVLHVWSEKRFVIKESCAVGGRVSDKVALSFRMLGLNAVRT